MSYHRFFLENQVLSDETTDVFRLELSKDDLRHSKVLRLEPGERLAVIDAESNYYIVNIESIDDESIFVRISSKQECKPRPGITLFQCLPKKDKYDDVVRAATEIGVSAFIPLVSDRCVAKLDKKKAEARVQRWQKIAKSAAMQSGQPKIPEVGLPVKLRSAEFTQLLSQYDLLLVFWEEADPSDTIETALSDWQFCIDSNVALVVGPEGGLSEEEVDYMNMNSKQCKIVSLGESILRTETASIVASALVVYELNKLRSSFCLVGKSE